MLNYFFGTKKSESIDLPPTPKRNIFVYLVVKKGCQTPLGIFDTLDEAKTEGQKTTYHNCAILKMKINDQCRYINNPIFEN